VQEREEEEEKVYFYLGRRERERERERERATSPLVFLAFSPGCFRFRLLLFLFFAVQVKCSRKGYGGLLNSRCALDHTNSKSQDCEHLMSLVRVNWEGALCGRHGMG